MKPGNQIQSSLNWEQIEIHKNRIEEYFRRNGWRKWSVIDTCRLDNGGILDLSSLGISTESSNSEFKDKEFVAFTPAAGSASRYTADLQGLAGALRLVLDKHESFAALREALNLLRTASIDQLPLPEAVSRLFSLNLVSTDQLAANQDALRAALEAIDQPKALYPCKSGGPSFLEFKAQENLSLKSAMSGQVFVAPQGLAATFEQLLSESKHLAADERAALPIRVLEQNLDLCTLRFDRDGNPIQNAEGTYSVVPAGHGMLSKLFPAVKRLFPETHSLFIRNIDNTVGWSDAVRKTSLAFLSLHSRLRRLMQAIRESLAASNPQSAERAAEGILATLKLDACLEAAKESSALYILQKEVFHTPETELRGGGFDELKACYARPLNLLGQVPNLGTDMGGTPVWAELRSDSFQSEERSERRKICLELPHMRDEDRTAFAANPLRATHFNPVFATCEITDDPDYYLGRSDDLWIVAEKPYGQSKAYYHETILYELVGSSSHANVLFIGIPRFLFVPNKSLADATGKH